MTAAVARLTLDCFPSPVGELLLVHDADERLCALGFGEGPWLPKLLKRFGASAVEPGSMPARTRDALGRYFAGEHGALAALPVRTAGTSFQERVWEALRAIPAGETWSYGRLAAAIGAPAAVRAVGLANGANGVAIAIPCHRVIGADGSLTGFGGGLERKRWLLAHEGAEVRAERQARLF